MQKVATTESTPAAQLTTPSIPARPRFGIVISLVPLVAFYALVLCYYAGQTIVTRRFGVAIEPVTSLVLSQLVAWPLTLWIAARLSRVSLADCFRSPGLSIATTGALCITVLGIVPVLLSIADLVPMSPAIRAAFENSTSGNQAVLVLAAVVIAPLAEEAMFRGILLSSFLKRYSRTKAIWATAILFALFHANPWQAVGALPLGLLFAWIVVKTGSLWNAILAHALSNFVAVVLMVSIFHRMGYSDAQISEMRFYPASIIGTSLVLAIVGFFLLIRMLRRSSTQLN